MARRRRRASGCGLELAAAAERAIHAEALLLIGIAGLLFPGDLLNDEGVNRAASEPEAGAGAAGRPSCGAGP